ncbi:FHA domain-containing protein [Acetobacter sacchari]|uniref:FHA domain-containing protein n=1 Tax=Acetobacter sacchari TaxID=2661687 RepID=A0ABS3LRP3_9PROT|nr:FHA domain-containing protein [Acetobacter sacchari]MBO1358569.1 FHA domain-containing protein [Acetobacter sacchari]
MTMLVLSMTSAPKGVQLETRCVSSGYFSIGRDATNDWVLADPHRQLSRRHCLFQQDEDGWSLSDMSRNGVSFDQGGGSSPVGAAPLRLGRGDRIKAGGYELVVDLQEDESSFRIMPLPGFVADAIKGLRASATATAAAMPPPRAPRRAGGKDVQDDTVELPRITASPRRGPAPEAPASPDALLEILGLDGTNVTDVRRSVILYRLSASMEAFVRGLRRLTRSSLDGIETDRRRRALSTWRKSPLAEDADDGQVLRWIAGLRNGRAEAPELAIADAFDEMQCHLVCVDRAYRRCARGVIEVLDPDYLPGQDTAQAADMLTPWRRLRATALLRKRHRRLRSNFDALFDAEFARAYQEEWERMTPR